MNILKSIRKNIKSRIIPAAAAASVLMCTVSYAGSAVQLDYVVHAGGQAGYETGTNSLEAINSSFDCGYRYIEMDLNFTSDGRLVCVHDWDTDYFKMGKPAGVALSLEEFKNEKILGKFTPMTVEELAKWLYERPDTYVITDIKENNIAGLKYIAENCAYIKERIMPQIYSEGEYAAIKDMGYTNIIYTLYKLSYSDKMNTDKIAGFAKSHELAAIVFSSELASDSYVKKLKACQTKLMTHTVNSRTEAERLKNMGIDGIYSDYLKENLK